MEPISKRTVYYILIVDDDGDDHQFLRLALNQVLPQAIIESVYDGAEALIYLEKCTVLPHIIFLDLNMARLSGRETLRRIYNDPRFANVPVIIYSTSRNEAEKKEMLNLGARDFYSKPQDSASLHNMVREVKEKWLSSNLTENVHYLGN